MSPCRSATSKNAGVGDLKYSAEGSWHAGSKKGFETMGAAAQADQDPICLSVKLSNSTLGE
jgi:hypothetical protein